MVWMGGLEVLETETRVSVGQLDPGISTMPFKANCFWFPKGNQWFGLLVLEGKLGLPHPQMRSWVTSVGFAPSISRSSTADRNLTGLASEAAPPPSGPPKGISKRLEERKAVSRLRNRGELWLGPVGVPFWLFWQKNRWPDEYSKRYIYIYIYIHI